MLFGFNFTDAISLGTVIVGIPAWLTYWNSRQGKKRQERERQEKLKKKQQDEDILVVVRDALEAQKKQVEAAANQITPSNGKTVATYIEENHILVAESRTLIEQTQQSVHNLIAQVDDLAGSVQEVQRAQFEFGNQLGLHLRESDDARERLNLPPEKRLE